MRNSTRWIAVGVAVAAVAFGLTTRAEAAPQTFADLVYLPDSNLRFTPTFSTANGVDQYLQSSSMEMIASLDILELGRVMADPPVVLAFNAPARGPDRALAPMPDPEPPPVQLASFTGPNLSGLAGLGTDGRAVPLGDTTYLAMGPGGYGGVMTGRPSGGMANWSHASQTAISYIRPHVNVQMMFVLELPGSPAEGNFEGPGMEPHAYLSVEHQTKVDSADIGASTTQFGGRAARPPVDEPQTAIAAGLDLGLLPTFLSQMGMGLSLVASRGEQTGNLRLAVVGTTELPVDWAPRERPEPHPLGTPIDPLIQASALPYPTGSGGVGGHPPREEFLREPPLIEIIPTGEVPEPATLALLAGGLALLLGRRKAGRTV